MKKTLLIVGGIALSLLSISAQAQEPTTPAAPTTPATTQPVAQPPMTTTSTTSTVWDAKKNPTVDSINAKYKDQLVPAREAMTVNQVFPVIGQYTSETNTDAANVTVTLDEQNKGIVWIDGLPQGRIKAMLRQSPATYKIPAQKTEDGKDVAEGTLAFDQSNNMLHIVIGKPYNVADPSASFADPAIGEQQENAPEVVKQKTKNGVTKTKKKTQPVVKPWMYTGTKVVTETAAN